MWVNFFWIYYKFKIFTPTREYKLTSGLLEMFVQFIFYSLIIVF